MLRLKSNLVSKRGPWMLQSRVSFPVCRHPIATNLLRANWLRVLREDGTWGRMKFRAPNEYKVLIIYGILHNIMINMFFHIKKTLIFKHSQMQCYELVFWYAKKTKLDECIIMRSRSTLYSLQGSKLTDWRNAGTTWWNRCRWQLFVSNIYDVNSGL